MAEMNQAPGKERWEWLGSKVEILTAVLAISKTQDHEPEEVWEEMHRHVIVNIHPYADFQSMRLALENDCDVDGYIAEQGRRQLGTVEVAADGQLDMSNVGKTGNRHRLPEIKLYLERPQNAFVGTPEEGDRMTWKGSLVEFMGLVLLTLTQTVRPPADPVIACEVICKRYRRFIQVDMGRFKDFNALYKAHRKDFNEKAFLRKGDRLRAAYCNVFTLGLHEGDRAAKPFRYQANYINKMADLFLDQWPEPGIGKFMLILGVIFITDDMLEAVLGK
ncbi:hypothetical protein [Paraflavitalea pollutisoli]|uniref:hypothetical protein n=1 Tax=Paraflavitalea pollutisoli TaxID=3034143 RepID=UPI0023EDBE24|nr:hypothetical protein [Paraflavitalea sp. H1-2-19X]